eukprot:scaffold12037_cov159-Ochromonas_danica.AAC.16
MDSYMEHAELNPLEVSGIPDLINLRILSNVVYFVGLAIAQEDSRAIITWSSLAVLYTHNSSRQQNLAITDSEEIAKWGSMLEHIIIVYIGILYLQITTR